LLQFSLIFNVYGCFEPRNRVVEELATSRIRRKTSGESGQSRVSERFRNHLVTERQGIRTRD
jgi:hypothetical protein